MRWRGHSTAGGPPRARGPTPDRLGRGCARARARARARALGSKGSCSPPPPPPPPPQGEILGATRLPKFSQGGSRVLPPSLHERLPHKLKLLLLLMTIYESSKQFSCRLSFQGGCQPMAYYPPIRHPNGSLFPDLYLPFLGARFSNHAWSRILGDPRGISSYYHDPLIVDPFTSCSNDA